MKTMILERFTSKGKILESDKAKLPDGVLCRAKYQICSVGKKNRNNRIYEREVWDKVLKDDDITEKLNNKSLFFHAEHPATTQSNTEKVAGVVTEIKLSGDKVYAIMEVLDTPYGKIIDTLLRAGCGIGVSTRADGELEECMDESGNKYSRVIPESYKFVTVDFTADPSSYGSEVPLEVQRNVAEVVKAGIENKKIDRDYATVLLEHLEVDEAKAILESMKTEKIEESEDVDDELNQLKLDLHAAYKAGDKAAASDIQHRIDGLSKVKKTFPEEQEGEEKKEKFEVEEAYEDKWKVGDEVLVGGDYSVGMQDWTGKITGINKEQGVAFVTGPDGEEEEVMLKNLYGLDESTLSSYIEKARKELYPDKDFHTLSSTEHDNVVVKAHELKGKATSESEEANETIVKKGKKWQVQSHSGKNMGTYDSEAEAKKRLGQVEYFKHKNESLKQNPFVVIDGKTYKIFRGEGAIAEIGDEENKVGISTFEPEVQKKIIRRLEEGLEDFVTPGSTEIWYFKDDYARDALMGSEWLKDKGMLPNPQALGDTHILLGTISLEDPEQIYSQMQGESWSPSGEAREFIQDLGLSHTSMSVGDVMVINGKPTMVDSLGFYDLSGESKAEVPAQESHYNKDSKRLIDEGRTPQELKDLIKDHYKQVTDPGEDDIPRMSKAEAIKHLALITMRSEKEIKGILKGKEGIEEAVQANIDVPDEKVNQFLNDNWGQFLNNEDAVNNLVKVFKVSAAKAKAFVDKASQGQGQLSLQYQLENKLKAVVDNYGKDCIKYSKLIEDLRKKSIDDLKVYSIKVEEAKKDKELAEKKAQEEIASLKESISKLNEKIEESKKASETRIKELKEAHRKELLKMYTETKIKCMGLKLNERRLTILESCVSAKEIDEQIREFQNVITESALQFNGVSEINVSVTPEKQDPKQVEIDRKVESAMSAWTGGTNK